jgi:hypothetical protein
VWEEAPARAIRNSAIGGTRDDVKAVIACLPIKAMVVDLLGSLRASIM